MHRRYRALGLRRVLTVLLSLVLVVAALIGASAHGYGAHGHDDRATLHAYAAIEGAETAVSTSEAPGHEDHGDPLDRGPVGCADGVCHSCCAILTGGWAIAALELRTVARTGLFQLSPRDSRIALDRPPKPIVLT